MQGAVVGVRIHHEVGVVRDYNDPPLAFGVHERPHKLFNSRFWIEIFFGLINDQGGGHPPCRAPDMAC